MFFDSHAHLEAHRHEDSIDDIIARAVAAKVTKIAHVGSGYEPAVFHEAVELADKNPHVYAVIGCHPHEADSANQETYAAVMKLLVHPKVVAVGEIGLDYYYNYSSKEGQRAAFVHQLEIAKRAELPVVIHCREAHDDCLAILGEAGLSSNPGIIHCYTGDIETARKYMELGFFISIPGVVTFPKAGELVKTVAQLPLDRMLIETDAPFLAPVPKRGRRNEPAFLPHTAEAVAKIKGLPVEEIARLTTANTMRVFGIQAD